MKLTDLDPKLTNNILVFDCPNCRSHRIRVMVGKEVGPDIPKMRVWKMTGEFPNITLFPSLDAGCWHGNIKEGEIINAGR